MTDPYGRTPEGLFQRILQRVKDLEDRLARVLPGRLSPLGQQTTDWDYALDDGFYWSTAAAPNNPVGDIAAGHVVNQGGPDQTTWRTIQEVWFPSNTVANQRDTWRRVIDRLTGTPTAWTLVSDGSSFGVLDAAYRIGGPAKVKVGGLDAPLTGPYNWRTPYVPNQSRVVSMVRTFGDEWEIVGQTEASPLGKFVPLVLGANWRVYSTVTSDPAWGWRVGATKLPSGLVSLTGLVRTMAVPTANQLIGTITDPDLWPEYDIAHSVEYGNAAVGITIKTDGRILTRFASGSGVDFLSLSGVNYWAAESDATGNWKNVGTNGITFDSHYADWGDPAYGFSALYKDRWGFVWGRGLVRTLAPQTQNSPIINLPVGYRPDREQHYRALSDNGFGFSGSGTPTAPNSINYKTGSPNAVGTWTSLYGIRLSTPDALTLNRWTTPGLFLNSWANYNAVQFPEMTWTRREDGLVLFRGLITGGALGAAVTNLLATPEIFIRPKGSVFAAVGADVRTRVDISGDTYNQTIAPLSGGVAWVSLDNIQYLP